MLWLLLCCCEPVWPAEPSLLAVLEDGEPWLDWLELELLLVDGKLLEELDELEDDGLGKLGDELDGLEDDELGMLGDELDELDDELGMLGDELDELEDDELGMLGMLEDDDELDVDWQPTNTTTADPTSKRVSCCCSLCLLNVLLIVLRPPPGGSVEMAGNTRNRGLGASILRLQRHQVNRFRENFSQSIQALNRP